MEVGLERCLDMLHMVDMCVLPLYVYPKTHTHTHTHTTLHYDLGLWPAMY